MPALLTLLESALSPFSPAKSPGFSTYVKKGGVGAVHGTPACAELRGGSTLQPPASNLPNEEHHVN